MKYKPEKDWLPKDNDVKTTRNVNRELKNFKKRIERKSSKFFLYLWNIMDDNKKSLILLNYNHFYEIIKTNDIDQIISELEYHWVFNEKDLKILKRKYLISKIIN